MKKLKDIDVTVPYWALDTIRLRASFYDVGEDQTSKELEAALDTVQALSTRQCERHRYDR